jgi:glutathione reductase (NADPH)
MVAEEYRMGGTQIRGCVPKKLLVMGSHVRHDRRCRGLGWTIPSRPSTGRP